MAIVGDRCWPQTAKQEGDKIVEKKLWSLWKQRNERPNAGGVSIRSKNTVLRLERNAWSMVK